MTGSPVTTSLLARALGEVSDGTLISDAAGTIIYANTAFTRITGYERSEIVGTDFPFLQGPSTSPAEVERMRDALDAAEVFQGTLLHYRKDGTSFWNHLTITPLKDAAGTLTHVVSVHRDVTDIVEERKKLTNAASHDLLTGLPNRDALRRHLRSEFGDAAEDGSVVALGLIDLDDFKLVNDQHGREAGDAVLAQFATRLSEVLRRGDYVARLGGDEFVVVISDLAPTDPSSELGGILDRIHTAVERPFDIGSDSGSGASVSVSMSMGLALFPGDGVAGRDLLRTADAVLYRVKGAKGLRRKTRTAAGPGGNWRGRRTPSAPTASPSRWERYPSAEIW